MASSLQSQLLKSGLADQKRVKKIHQQQLEAGKNAKIDMTLKKPATMPDMGMVSGAGKAAYSTKRLSPLDKFKEGK